ARSDLGLTPLLFAVRQGDVASVELLLKAGADVNERAVLADGTTKMGIYSDSMWTWPSVDGSTALIMATENGHYNLAMLLLKSGANPNLQAEAYPYLPKRPAIGYYGDSLRPGFTALHAVAARRGRSRGSDPVSLELMKELIARGADVNAFTPGIVPPQP